MLPFPAERLLMRHRDLLSHRRTCLVLADRHDRRRVRHVGIGEGDLDDLVRAVGGQLFVPPEVLRTDPGLEDAAATLAVVQDRNELVGETASL